MRYRFSAYLGDRGEMLTERWLSSDGSWPSDRTGRRGASGRSDDRCGRALGAWERCIVHETSRTLSLASSSPLPFPALSPLAALEVPASVHSFVPHPFLSTPSPFPSPSSPGPFSACVQNSRATDIIPHRPRRAVPSTKLPQLWLRSHRRPTTSRRSPGRTQYILELLLGLSPASLPSLQPFFLSIPNRSKPQGRRRHRSWDYLAHWTPCFPWRLDRLYVPLLLPLPLTLPGLFLWPAAPERPPPSNCFSVLRVVLL